METKHYLTAGIVSTIAVLFLALVASLFHLMKPKSKEELWRAELKSAQSAIRDLLDRINCGMRCFSDQAMCLQVNRHCRLLHTFSRLTFDYMFCWRSAVGHIESYAYNAF